MKLLKLVGTDSYTSPLTKLTRVLKGEVIAVDDATAAYMEAQFERKYDMDLPHWAVQPEGTKVDHSFTSEFAVAPVEQAAPTITHNEEPEPEAAADATDATDAAVTSAAEETATEEAPEAATKPATQRVKRA